MRIKRLFRALLLGMGLTLILVWVLSGSPLPVARADSVSVDIFGDVVSPDGSCSLREAIVAAGLDISGYGCNLVGGGPDVIYLDTGTYALTRIGTGEDTGLTGDLDITDTLAIVGNGPEQTIIDATGLISDRVFHIHSTTATVVISGVRIIGGNLGIETNNRGGGIYNDGAELILINTIVEANAAAGDDSKGGGVFVDGGSVRIEGGQILSNSATYGGGLGILSAQAGLNDSQILSNSASFGGGVDVSIGVVTQTGDSLIAYNSAIVGGGMNLWSGGILLEGGQILYNDATYGGGAYMYSGGVTLSGTQMAHNSADSHGGGLYLISGSATLTNATVLSNTAGSGGGIYVRTGSVVLAGGGIISNTGDSNGGGVHLQDVGAVFTQTGSSAISYNRVGGRGGGIYLNSGAATLSGAQIISNTAGNYGGGIYVLGSDAKLTLAGDNLIRENATGGNGAGVYISSGAMTLHGGQILSNTAGFTGGGIDVGGGTLTQTGTTIIAHNTAGGLGGGVAGGARTTLHGAQIFDNYAFFDGGGVSAYGDTVLSGTAIFSNTSSSDGGGIYNTGLLRLINTTVSGNRAPEGGGLWNSAGTAVLTFTTVANNAASGIHAYGGTVLVEDSLIAYNTAGNCNGAALISRGHNLEFGDTCGLTATTDLTDTDPLLGALVGDGDSTVHALLPGSPAIDAGLCIAGISTDQRGVARPQGLTGRCDIGAYEVYVPIPPTGVEITGPAQGATNRSYAFTATVTPPTATLPITYVWHASGQEVLSRVQGLSDTAFFTWTLPGSQIITVTATNIVDTVVATHTFAVDEAIGGLAASNDGPAPSGQDVTLTATVLCGSNIAYTWDFGDRTTGFGQVVTHAYGDAGVYTAVVTASNAANFAIQMTVVTIEDYSIYLPLVVRE